MFITEMIVCVGHIVLRYNGLFVLIYTCVMSHQCFFGLKKRTQWVRFFPISRGVHRYWESRHFNPEYRALLAVVGRHGADGGVVSHHHQKLPGPG